MTEPKTVCERSARGDYSLNQCVLKTLHQYYLEKAPCSLAEEDPDLFVFLRSYRDYHGGIDEENISSVKSLYHDRFAIDKPLPHFVARQFDLLVAGGKIRPQ